MKRLTLLASICFSIVSCGAENYSEISSQKKHNSFSEKIIKVSEANAREVLLRKSDGKSFSVNIDKETIRACFNKRSYLVSENRKRKISCRSKLTTSSCCSLHT